MPVIVLGVSSLEMQNINTVFPHIVSMATIVFWIYISWKFHIVSASYVKVIHREFSSAHFFLIVDLRERGTLLQHKNRSKKSQAKKF